MKTWNDYKQHVRTVDPEMGKEIDEVENITAKRSCCYVWYSTIICSTH